MRYLLLVVLVALAVVLVLHFGTGREANPVKESGMALDKAKMAALTIQLQQVEAALDAFASEQGSYPGDLNQVVPAYLPSAEFLVDPWGTPLRLEPGEGERPWLVSAGPDRALGSGDDIRRSLR